MTTHDADIIVVGSGPAGAQAAEAAIAAGATVVVIDVGVSDRALESGIPLQSFATLRRTDPEQARYFIGDLRIEDIDGVKGGAQLTPPRAYITRSVQEWTPVESTTFAPVLSLAAGGLGAAWGAGCAMFSQAECDRAHLDFARLGAAYDEVAESIGISGPAADDTTPLVGAPRGLQPAHEPDDNAAAIISRYQKHRASLNARGFRLGRPMLAMLSQDRPDAGGIRSANPLLDMDMYTDRSRSVYRPWMTIEALARNGRFRYRDGLLALRFQETPGGVEVACTNMRTGLREQISGRRLVIAAGALNSAALVARSLGDSAIRLPLLCNRYRYLPAINAAMLGRPARDARHSLAQLVAMLTDTLDDPNGVFVSIYSYRSLLLYRLAAQMPLPAALGLLAARVLVSSFTICGVHFPDAASPSKYLDLGGPAESAYTLRPTYHSNDVEERFVREKTSSMRSVLPELGLFPLTTVEPPPGASIHYAGTLPRGTQPAVHATGRDGVLYGVPRVRISDSSTWNFLPAKGPTFTIMAQARLTAQAAVAELRAEGLLEH